jgi:hypothetical protein
MFKIIGADQKEYGPVSAEQIRHWIAEGRVNAHTKVQAAGAAEWKSAADFPDLAGALPKAPVPLPVTLPPAYPPSPATSQMAIWAMVTGILSIICCQVLAPVAIVLGAVALSHLKEHRELTGRGFAIAGIVLGVLALLLTVLFVVALISSPQLLQNLQNALGQ